MNQLNNKIKETGYQGEHLPKFQWEATASGQANYISIRCEQEGIRVMTQGQRVLIFSKRRIPDLLKIIEESMQYLHLPYPTFCMENLVCRHDKAILGVMVKESGYCYTTEKHFRELRYHLFKREIPQLTHYRIFNTTRELKEYVEQFERITL